MSVSKILRRLLLLSISCTYVPDGFFAGAFSAIPLKADSVAMNPFFGSLVEEPTVIYQEQRSRRRTVKRSSRQPLTKRKQRGRGTISATTAFLVEAPPATSPRTNQRRKNIETNTPSKAPIPSGITRQPETQPRRRDSDERLSYHSKETLPKLEDIEKPILRDPSEDTTSVEKVDMGALSPSETLAELLRRRSDSIASNDLRPRSVRKRAAFWESQMEKRKYYQKKLLTVDEEYELGMKVQFMVRCEKVHRGLSISLERVPTFIEWAAACGFVDPCADRFSDTSFEHLRPEGFEEMFEETDPDYFVGTGLAHEAGPGRGCARKEAPPPIKLGNWYDDSVFRAQMRAYEADKSEPKPVKGKKIPLNRGDVARFVELLNEGREAKQRMIECNMRLVVSIAGKYSQAGVGLMDLVQEGSIGLHRAARKYEPKKGFKFSTYASWWIQQAVFRSIAYHSRSIRLPVHVHNHLNQIRKVQRHLTVDLQRKPTPEEMARRLGLPLKKYNYLIYLMKQTTSLDSPAYKQNPKDSYFESSDLVSDTVLSRSPEDARTAEREVDQSLFLQDLGKMLDTLDEDERVVINLRYGLRDGLCRSVTNIAEALDKSKTWVRSKECRALRKLRRPWYEKKLREYEEAFGSG